MIKTTVKASEWDTIDAAVARKDCYALTTHGLYVLNVLKRPDESLHVVSSDGSWELIPPEDEEYHVFWLDKKPEHN